jgi:DNA-binding transcriptional LysR family regulator
MELSRLDLNLLLVFHHLLLLKRVSAVAVQLNMSQPAVSSALGRLRTSLGDDLFLRTQHGMAPTPYALQLAQPVASALDMLQQAFTLQAPFQPKTSTRHFTIAMTDVGEIYFLPLLIDALAKKAPSVTLQIVNAALLTLKEDMTQGAIDLALGFLPQLKAGFYQQVLFKQSYVCLMRQSHPLANLKTLSLEDFVAADHVRVISEGTGHGRVDTALDKQKISRRIRLTVPLYIALGDVLKHSNLIATVPQRFAECVVRPFNLMVHPLPMSIEDSPIHQFWHSRLHRDSGHQWLRKLVSELFSNVRTPTDDDSPNRKIKS